MIDPYLRELGRSLDARGVRGRDAERALAEARDHLLENAAADGEHAAVRAFGAADGIAAQIAAELATMRTRVAVYGAFGVLGLAGAAFTALFLSLPAAGTRGLGAGAVPGLGALGLAGIVFFSQVAFACGSLGLVRTLRSRRDGALPAGELGVQRSRSAAALLAGGLTFASLAVVALDYLHVLAGWWVAAALGTSAGLALLLGAAAAALLRAGRPRAGDGAAAGDALDDLRALADVVPLGTRVPLPRTPRSLAFEVAALAGVSVALAGAVAGDPFDGLLRGAVEAVAVLTCWAALGRRLALR